MKKTLVMLVTVLAMLLVLAGCNKTVMSGEMAEDGKSYVVTCDKASENDFMMGGSLIIEEGETIHVDSALEGDGKLAFTLISTAEGEDMSAEELEELTESEGSYEFSITGNDSMECGVDPGDYYIKVVAVSKATGTCTITVAPSEQIANPWTDVATAEEAAKGAGLDGFSLEGGEISLGPVEVTTYRYMDGIAEAAVEFPAVSMTVRKGTGSDDISGDYNEYANEWTQNIKGLEVTCYGNREGEATKTIWTSGDYSYSITAYGLGGDTDYGLSADDLNTIINGLQ